MLSMYYIVYRSIYYYILMRIQHIVYRRHLQIALSQFGTQLEYPGDLSIVGMGIAWLTRFGILVLSISRYGIGRRHKKR